MWCREQIEEQGVDVERILMVGGGTKSTAVRAVAPTVFGGAVSLPADGEWVALGAARQAAWALTGRRPSWPVDVEELSGHTRPEVYATYRDVVARSTR